MYRNETIVTDDLSLHFNTLQSKSLKENFALTRSIRAIQNIIGTIWQKYEVNHSVPLNSFCDVDISIN